MIQPQLFNMPKVDPTPRAPRRVLMHVVECTTDGHPDDDSVFDAVRFGCKRCDHETGWQMMRISDAKRGIPCPTCNNVTR